MNVKILQSNLMKYVYMNVKISQSNLMKYVLMILCKRNEIDRFI